MPRLSPAVSQPNTPLVGFLSQAKCTLMAGGVWWWRGFGGGDGGVIRRVEESDIGDRVDPEVGSVFGLRRICPPEKFSGGGEWWPAAGELAGEERENLAFSLILTIEAITSSICFLFLLEDWDEACSGIGAGRPDYIPSSLGIFFNLSYLLLNDVIKSLTTKCYNRLSVWMDSDISNTFRLDSVCHSPHVFFSSPPVELAGNEFFHNPNPFPYDNIPDFYDQPPQPQYQQYSCELCGNDSHYGFDYPPRLPLEKLHKALQAIYEKLSQQEQAATVSTHTPEPSRRFNFFYDDDEDDDDGDDDNDDEESTIPLNEITSQIPPSIAITPVLPTMDPEDSLIMGDEDLSTIPEKESEEFIKSSVEDLVPIPSESEDTSDSDSECDLPFYDNYVTFSNPLFDANDDFTSSDDESLPEEDDIESEDSYVSKHDDPDLLVTPLSKLNKDGCFDPGGDFVLEEIEACLTSDSIPPGIDDADFDPEGDILLLEKLLNDDLSSPIPPKELNFKKHKVIKSDVSTDFEDDYYDSEGDIIYLESLLIKDTIPNLLPEVFLDHGPKNLKDELDNGDLKSMVKISDPGIWENFFPTFMKLPFEDRHYLFLTYVIRNFLPYFTYPVDSSFLLSSGSEDTIFDPGISVFSFYSLEPMVSHQSGTFMCFNVYLNILNGSPMEIRSSTCFVPNITMIWGEIAPDYEDSHARGFVHCSLDLQSLACLFMGIRYPRSY
ncbi:hypothetical protein Tco_0217150 [Tanacetum coccineum]